VDKHLLRVTFALRRKTDLKRKTYFFQKA